MFHAKTAVEAVNTKADSRYFQSFFEICPGRAAHVYPGLVTQPC